MSFARRHHQRSVQENAIALIEQLAEDRGWTTEELADRTIPTAGFDSDGVLRLSFGKREFTGRIAATGLIELTNPEGKTIKSLPKSASSDNEERASESRKQLTASRKELKAIVAAQTGRLYEAMCAQREWAAQDWTEFLLKHPIMASLVSRVVWVATATGKSGAESVGNTDLILFRPVQNAGITGVDGGLVGGFVGVDGGLIGVDGEPVTLPDNARISVAHTAILSAQDTSTWIQHLVDDSITALFDQFSNAVPELSDAQTRIADLQGHLTDSYSLRNTATQRGYVRGTTQDAGWFYNYTKNFPQAGTSAQIDFTGSFLPEETLRVRSKRCLSTTAGEPLC